QTRGAFKQEEFIMGVAFTCGLEKVVLPSFKLGMPVEYELIRSIATVSGDQRKKLGVVKTDAEIMGAFSFSGMQPRQIPKQLIVDVQRRQYTAQPAQDNRANEDGRYDVLLSVSPSSLGPAEALIVVDDVWRGQRAVIFEGPLHVVMPAPGATKEKMAGGGMF